MCTHSWNDKGHSPRPCPLVSSSAAVSYEAQSKVNTVQQFRCHPRCIVYSLSSTLTSVRRTALCWDAMLPRPEQACGSSVMLCSPSCSASLSERFAPLWEHKIVLRTLHASFTSVQPHTTQSLTSTAAHWCPQACTCWGTAPASASWHRGSCQQGRPSGCCLLGTRVCAWVWRFKTKN